MIRTWMNNIKHILLEIYQHSEFVSFLISLSEETDVNTGSSHKGDQGKISS